MTNDTTSADAQLIALVEQFEKGMPPSAAFHHVEHVKVAFAYLCIYPKLQALEKFANGIRLMAIAKGKPQAYHETITWTYVFLIHERMIKTATRDWEQFTAANPDLLDWKNSILSRYYSKALLDSDLARQVYVMPDLPPAS